MFVDEEEEVGGGGGGGGRGKEAVMCIDEEARWRSAAIDN